MTAQELAGLLLQHPQAEVSISVPGEEYPVTEVVLVDGRMVIA